MVGGAVLLPDSQDRQDVFELVAAATVAGGVDATVIGQRGRGCPVDVDAGEEGIHDVAAGHRAMDGAGQQEPGVVVEPVQDLHVGARSRANTGRCPLAFLSSQGLPALIEFNSLSATRLPYGRPQPLVPETRRVCTGERERRTTRHQWAAG